MMQNQAQESDTLISMRQRVRDSFERQGLMHHLGITVESIEPGEVRLKMPFRPELTQQHGFFHAGGTSALAYTAGGYAGFTLFPQDSSVLTVERSEEHTSGLQSLMRNSYAVFCLKKKKQQ